jgi:hypothetical protein
MASRHKRSFAASAAATPAARRKMEQLEPNICTYWPTNPAFDPKKLLLRRLFFINVDRTKYVFVGFYPARDYLPLVEFGAVRRGGGLKTIILSDEQVNAMAECLPLLRDAMCGGNPVGGSGCKSGVFRLDVTRSHRMARLYVDSQYISLTLLDIDYLSRMYNVVQQQLGDYIVAMPDVLPYVMSALTSVTYVEPAPNASTNINFPHLYEELTTFV